MSSTIVQNIITNIKICCTHVHRNYRSWVQGGGGEGGGRGHKNRPAIFFVGDQQHYYQY